MTNPQKILSPKITTRKSITLVSTSKVPMLVCRDSLAKVLLKKSYTFKRKNMGVNDVKREPLYQRKSMPDLDTG